MIPLNIMEGFPRHHIDTSIVLEPTRTVDGINCRKHLQKVGYKYHGMFSIPVLGELLLSIARLGNYNEKHDSMDAILQLIKVRNIEFYSPRNIEETAIKIRKIDSRIKPLDSHILACAIEDKSTLVTLDRKLINNNRIEKEFQIRIMHPSLF
jgi:predicted nucleic acid-binding protein